jgi:hypothetical protein
MNLKDSDIVKSEFRAAKELCESERYSAESLANFQELMDRWTRDPNFVTNPHGDFTRVCVLNEITFLILHEHLGDPAKRKIKELAAQTSDDDPNGMRTSMHISTFELIAEPPGCEAALNFLYSSAHDPATRWTVFTAYKRWPGRFRKHLIRYSNGAITEDDYLRWLDEQGLELTSRGIRYRGPWQEAPGGPPEAQGAARSMTSTP